MTSIHHFFHSETAETFNKAKGFCWLFVSAHLCVFVCLFVLCLLFLHHHPSHPSSSSSSSPSPPVCLAGGSDSQHPHCVVALFYSPSVSFSLFILFLPHSVSFFLFHLCRVGKRACISIYPIGGVKRGCSVVRCR